MGSEKYAIGVDFGTDSVRAAVIDVRNGMQRMSGVSGYARWAEGKYCSSERNQFRQHPNDYLCSLESAIAEALSGMPSGTGQDIAAISVAATGSTVCAVDNRGVPLALSEGFEENPDAMFLLWKDHTAIEEAEEISHAARSWGGADFTRYEGASYSCEWFWAKILHVLRVDEAVRRAAASWMELCDWIPAVLTGNHNLATIMRSRCAAGHKAMWNQEWGGLPPEEFLVKIDPFLAGLRSRLYDATFTADAIAGYLAPTWAERLGLQRNTIVTVGAFDAHMGAVGGGVRRGILSKILGTSCCDMTVAVPAEFGDRAISGICGQVDGSIIPGLVGIEAGQSAFGDVFDWLVNVVAWPILERGILVDDNRDKDSIKKRVLECLTEEASRLAVGSSPLALDWFNGRRTPDADQKLKGAVVGLTLGSDAPRVFRALVEATAFGSRATVERLIGEGVKIAEIHALGGIAQKSPFVLQVMADVMNLPIRVAGAEQACALGAAMFGATAAGFYDTVVDAQKKMGCGFSCTYMPRPETRMKYELLYRDYVQLGKSLEPQLRRL